MNMTDAALNTLFLPFEHETLDAQGTAVFFGAQDHPVLRHFEHIECVQHWVTHHPALKHKNLTVFTDPPESRTYGTALCLLPKQKEHAKAMLARAALSLDPNGTLVAAASNDAGGTRLQKWMRDLGFEPHSLSKNKCRTVWGQGQCNQETAQEWVTQGAARQIQLEDLKNWWTQPGIFGWDKIDRGSKLLTTYIPHNIKGDIADFGCGTGYLSHFVKTNCSKIKTLTAIDADMNALEMCTRNVESVRTYAADLAHPVPNLEPFDTILMNPPFHKNKQTSSDLGVACIKTAHHHLKPRGHLYMVANVHLGYEKTLSTLFTKVDKLTEQNGFKVFKGIK